jgi:hypothetical protein
MEGFEKLARKLHGPSNAVSGEICRLKGTFFIISGEI